MPSVLITGARAPAALELVRAFQVAGWTCYTADTFRFTVCSGSRCLRRHFVIPSPRYEWEEFSASLRGLVADWHIDLVVPTCEEVFYLAALQLPQAFCSPLALLRKLHSKWDFLGIAARLSSSVKVPKSGLAVSASDLPSDPRQCVFKREFSRFGSFTRVGNSRSLRPSPGERWVIQERLHGEELSSYAVALAGRVTAWSLYRPVHRVGSASSVYFRHHRDSRALDFTRALVAELDYTGQIGFDFMDTEAGLFVLECNPRATSGIHLVGGLSAAFTDPGSFAEGSGERMLAAAMPLALKHTSWALDFVRGRDVLWSKDDPWPALALFPHLLETLWRGLRGRCSLKQASTADIEWDGATLWGGRE